MSSTGRRSPGRGLAAARNVPLPIAPRLRCPDLLKGERHGKHRRRFPRLEIARGHLTCAEILLLDGEPEEAAWHLAKAERYFGAGADADDYGLLRRHQSREALLRGEPQEAIALARQALDFVKEHQLSQGSVWYALGSAQAAAGNLDAAVESFERAAELLEQGGEWREATAVYREWAQGLRAAGRESEAVDVMERATSVAVRGLGAEARESGRRS